MRIQFRMDNLSILSRLILCIIILFFATTQFYFSETLAQQRFCDQTISLDDFYNTDPGTIGIRITGDPIDELRLPGNCQNVKIQTVNTYKTIEIFVNTSNYCPRGDDFCKSDFNENAFLIAAKISSYDSDVVRNLGPGSIYRSAGWVGPRGTSMISGRSFENEYRRFFHTVEELSEFYDVSQNSSSPEKFLRFDDSFHARTPIEGHPSWPLGSAIDQFARVNACAGIDRDCSARFYMFNFVTRPKGPPSTPMRAEIVMNLATEIDLIFKSFPELRYNRRLNLAITTPTPTPRPASIRSP